MAYSYQDRQADDQRISEIKSMVDHMSDVFPEGKPHRQAELFVRAQDALLVEVKNNRYRVVEALAEQLELLCGSFPDHPQEFHTIQVIMLSKMARRALHFLSRPTSGEVGAPYPGTTI